MLEAMRREIEELRREVAELKARPCRCSGPASEVAERIPATAAETDAGRKGGNVLGFSLSSAKGYWYANKRVGGRNNTVYVGRDRTKAAERILAKFRELAERS